jgi:hypothetical protein
MNFKKTVSAFAALTMAISVFASFGVTANAETADATVKMTYVNYDDSSTSYGEIAAGETATTGYNKISSGSVAFANTGYGVDYITYLQVDASAIEGTITKATLTAEISGSTDGTAGDKRIAVVGVGYNTSTWSADMTYATADKTITTVGETASTTTKRATVFESKSWDITDALKNDDDKVVTILMYATNAAGSYIKNPAVSITYVDANATLYTATFTETNGLNPEVTVYSDENMTSSIGADSLLADTKYYYKATLTGYEDYTGDFTLTADGSKEISFTMVAKEIVTASLNVKSGDTVLGTYTKDVYSGDTTTIYYPAVIENDGTYYLIAADTTQNASYWGKSCTGITSDNKSFDAAVTATVIENAVYAAEVEDMTNGNTLTTDTSYPNRYSKGVAYTFGSSEISTTTLPAGTYKVFVGARNGGGAERTIDVKGGSSTETLTWSRGDTSAQSAEITLEDEGTISLASKSSDKLALDYVYVVAQPALKVAVAETVDGTSVPSIADDAAVKSADDSSEITYAELKGEKLVKTIYAKLENPTSATAKPTITIGGAAQSSVWTPVTGTNIYFAQFIGTADDFAEGGAFENVTVSSGTLTQNVVWTTDADE